MVGRRHMKEMAEAILQYVGPEDAASMLNDLAATKAAKSNRSFRDTVAMLADVMDHAVVNQQHGRRWIEWKRPIS